MNTRTSTFQNGSQISSDKGRMVAGERLTELVENRRMAYEATFNAALQDYRAVIELEPTGTGGTVITWRGTWRARPDIGWLMPFVLPGIMQRMPDDLAAYMPQRSGSAAGETASEHCRDERSCHYARLVSQPTSPPPPGFAPDAVLSFTVQGNIMTSNLVAPTLTIDGYLAPVPITGTRQIPIMSGRHHLRVHSQWLRRYGHAALDIDVAPGQDLEVFYAPPYHQFSDHGSMGLAPQTRKGRGFIVGMWVVLGLVILLPVAGVVAVLVSG